MLRRTGAKAGTRPGWQQRLAALLLVLFAVQTTIVQTHIHLLQLTHGAVRVVPAQSPSGANPFDDPATCPLCQDMALVGHYLAPAPVALALPALAGIFVALFAPRPAAYAAPAHGWQSRGPPSD